MMGSNFTVVYDACVLYPAPLRDLLMHLALSDLFKARWTDKIHEEWMRNVLKNRPDLTLDRLTRTKTLMNSHVRDCLVTDYEWLIPCVNLPDPGDRHVLAAAIATQADAIVTVNLKDFPQSVLEAYNIEAQHPDDFIADLIDLSPQTVVSAVQICLNRLKNPPKSLEEYLELLWRQELIATVAILSKIHE